MRCIRFLTLFTISCSLFTVARAQDSLFQHPAGQITTQVVSCYPPQNFTHCPLADSLTITFAQSTPINPGSLTDSTFVVQAQQSGWHQGAATYNAQTNTITFKPTKPFFVGELVTAVATKKITYDSAGTNVAIHGFAWQFYGKVTKKTQATFRDTVQMDPGGVAILSALADVNEIGNVDILYEHAPADVIAYNSGDGIHYQNTSLNIAGNMFPSDYHLRGLMDVVDGYDSCYFETNNGNKTFSYGHKQTYNAEGEFNYLAEINYDGIPEIITEGNVKGAQGEYDSVNIYSVIGDSIAEQQSFFIDATGGGIGIATADFNNDGAIDVAVTYGNNFAILYNDGTGILFPPKLVTSTTGIALGGTVAVDMDNDGWVDVVGPIIGLGVGISHNNGDGTFTAIQSFNSTIPFSKQTVSFGFNVADCDGDGLMDAVLTPVDLQTDSMFVVTEKNAGNDSLKVSQIIPEGNNLGQYPYIYLGDMFHTGYLDAVISFSDAGTIHIYNNDSNVAPVSVAENPVTTPDGYSLNENFPNPSSNVTNISYNIPTTETINISIYDVNGQLLTTVVNGLVVGGTNTATYDCSSLHSGTYFVRLVAASTTLSQEFTITH